MGDNCIEGFGTVCFLSLLIFFPSQKKTEKKKKEKKMVVAIHHIEACEISFGKSNDTICIV